ncbi:MAG: YcbK family protein [Deltaproteobacteria bacterium]|nr:YcbK family protein [Deltaproteobacteria bacterium]
MTLYHANFRKSLTLRLFDRCGRPNKRAPKQMSHFLRCYQTKRRKTIHTRLVKSLYSVSRAFKGRRLIVYSGYRSPRVAKLKRSYHTRGRAIDFRVEGVSRRKLRNYVMKSFKKIGVGFYPNTPFIHMDVREKRSAFWVDFSSNGEDSRYAKNPYQLLRKDQHGVPMKERRRLWVIFPSDQILVASATPKASTPRGQSAPMPLAPLQIAPVAAIPPLPPLPSLPPLLHVRPAQTQQKSAAKSSALVTRRE